MTELEKMSEEYASSVEARAANIDPRCRPTIMAFEAGFKKCRELAAVQAREWDFSDKYPNNLLGVIKQLGESEASPS